MKWADFVQRFDDDHLSTLAPKSRETYLRGIELFAEIVGPGFLDQVDESSIARFRSKRLAAGVTEATVNKDLRYVRCALNKARKWRLIDDRIDVELLREPERDPEYIDDDTFAKLYAACDAMVRPRDRHYTPKEWWQALLKFAYLTGWRIGQILALLRDNVDWSTGIAFVPAEETKGKRDSRVELHPVILDHLKPIVDFEPAVFDWPHHERTLWADFAALKKAAGVEINGAFHRFKFGFANANVGRLDADVLQTLMLHQDSKTTRHDINTAERMRRQRTADTIHVPDVLAKKA